MWRGCQQVVVGFRLKSAPGTRSTALRVVAPSRSGWERNKSFSVMVNSSATMLSVGQAMWVTLPRSAFQLGVAGDIAELEQRIPGVKRRGAIQVEGLEDLPGKFKRGRS